MKKLKFFDKIAISGYMEVYKDLSGGPFLGSIQRSNRVWIFSVRDDYVSLTEDDLRQIADKIKEVRDEHKEPKNDN